MRRRINLPARIVGTTRVHREPYYKARERGRAFARAMAQQMESVAMNIAGMHAISAAILNYQPPEPDDTPRYMQ